MSSLKVMGLKSHFSQDGSEQEQWWWWWWPGPAHLLKLLINSWAAVLLDKSLQNQVSLPRFDANQPENRQYARGTGLCWPGKADSWPQGPAKGPAWEVHSPLGLGTSAQWNIYDIAANVMSTGNWQWLQLNHSLKERKVPRDGHKRELSWPGPGEIELEIVPAWFP